MSDIVFFRDGQTKADLNDLQHHETRLLASLQDYVETLRMHSPTDDDAVGCSALTYPFAESFRNIVNHNIASRTTKPNETQFRGSSSFFSGVTSKLIDRAANNTYEKLWQKALELDRVWKQLYPDSKSIETQEVLAVS